VVVPTRNSETTLERCLDSIRAQIDAPVKVVVVDNQSTDATPAIARAKADVCISAGPERSAQRNIGASEADGGWLLFVDADMLLEPAVCAEVAAAFAGGTADALVVPEYSIGRGYWAGCKALEKRLYLGDPHIEAARAFRSEIFAAVGGYDELLSAGEDWDLHERVLAKGGVVGRIEARIFHDEGSLTLSTMVRKKFYYGRTLGRYARNHPRSAASKLLRTALIRRPELLARDPVHAVGLILMKILEACAVLAGVAAARASGTATRRTQ
jgi:glycosyltransferase involved in cell wall biosynthesis